MRPRLWRGAQPRRRPIGVEPPQQPQAAQPQRSLPLGAPPDLDPEYHEGFTEAAESAGDDVLRA
eukprot:11227141-Lingulodinium_polyedra.AAC.1